MAIVRPDALSMMIQTSSKSVEKLVKPKLMATRVISPNDIYPLVVEVDLFPHHARSGNSDSSRRNSSSFCYRKYEKSKATENVFHSKRIQLFDDDDLTTEDSHVQNLQKSLTATFNGHQTQSEYILLVRIERSLDGSSSSTTKTNKKTKGNKKQLHKRWSWPLDNNTNRRRKRVRPTSSFSSSEDTISSQEMEICYCLFLRSTGEVAYVDRRPYNAESLLNSHSVHEEIMKKASSTKEKPKVVPRTAETTAKKQQLPTPKAKVVHRGTAATAATTATLTSSLLSIPSPPPASTVQNQRHSSVFAFANKQQKQIIQERISAKMEQKNQISVNATKQVLERPVVTIKQSRCDDDQPDSDSFSRRKSSRGGGVTLLVQ